MQADITRGEAGPLAGLDACVEVLESAVHAGVGGDAQEVDLAAVVLGGGDGVVDRLIGEKRFVFDRNADADRFLIHDPAGTDVLVADLRITHRAVGQPDVAAGGVDQRGGISVRECFGHGGVGEFHGVEVVVLGVGIFTPTVSDDQDHGLGGHSKSSSCWQQIGSRSAG